MPLSQDFRTWLGNPDNPKIMLAIVRYYDTEERIEYLSSHPYIGNVGGIDIPFKNRIIGAPSFKVEVSAIDSTRTSNSIGELTINNADGKFDDWMSYGVDGRTIELYIGPPSGAFDTEFARVLLARVDRLTYPSDNLISIIFKDRLDDLDKPIQDNTYIVAEPIPYTLRKHVTYTTNPLTRHEHDITNPTATSVITPTDLEDKPKPLAYGLVRNITPILLSAATRTYQVHQGAINGTLIVYDTGVPVHFKYDNLTGIFELDNNSTGEITCDVEGAILGTLSDTYSEYLSDILKDIVVLKGGVASNDVIDNRVSGLLSTGLYITERRNILDVLDELVRSIDGYYGFNIEGKFFFGSLAVPSNPIAQKLTGRSVTRYGDIFYEDFTAATYTKSEEIPKYIIASDQIAQNEAKSTAEKTASYFLLTKVPNNIIFSITNSDTTGDLGIVALSNVAYKNTVKYERNYTVQTDLAAGTEEDQKEFAQFEYRQRVANEPSIQTKFISAIDAPEVITTFSGNLTIDQDTLLNTGLTGADLLLARLRAKNSEVLYEVTFTCLLGRIIEANIGSIINLKDRRFGFKEGRLVTLTSMDIDYLAGKCTIKGIFYAKPFGGISDKYLLDKSFYSISGTNNLTYVINSDPDNVNDGVIITNPAGSPATGLFECAQYSYIRYFEIKPRLTTTSTLTLRLAVTNSAGTILETQADTPVVKVSRNGSVATITWGKDADFLTLVKTVPDWNNYTIGVVYDFNSNKLNIVTEENSVATVSATYSTNLSNKIAKSILVTTPANSSYVLTSQNFRLGVRSNLLLPWTYIAAPAGGAPIFFPGDLLLQDEAGNFLLTEDGFIIQTES